LYRKLEQHEEALAAFQKAIEQNATDVVSWNGLGDLYHLLGRNDDAIYAYLKATELSPDFAPSWSGLGTSYICEGRLDDALVAHQKALEINRRTINSWLDIGDIYRLQGNSENAKIAYQTAIEIDPKNARAWNGLGIIYYNTGAYDEATRAYTKAIELDPGTVHPKEVPSQVEANLDPVAPPKDDSANPIVNVEPKTSREITPASEPADPVIVYATNKVPAANDTEPVSPKSDNEFAEWLDKLGNISSISTQLKKRSKAEQGSMEMADVSETETVPELPSTTDEPTTPAEDDASESVFPASESSQTEKAAGTTDTEPKTGKAFLSAPANIDDTTLQSGTPEDKINDQSQANIDAKNAQIWNELGSIYINTGAYDEAIQAFGKATELDPSYGWPYNNLASIYFQKGRYSEAALLYQKAIRHLGETKEKALIWNRLGDTYRRLNERNHAAVAYQKAAELDPDHVSLLTRARLSLLGNHQA
jgi:superkiller protein 3